VETFCLPLLILAVSASGSSRQIRQTPVTIPLPAQWVPFSADLKERQPDGYSHGKFYRATDGSTAFVIDSAAGPVITINNTRSKRRYSMLPGLGWIEQPIPDAQLDPPRQQLVLGGMSVQKLDMTVAGGEVYEMITGPRHMRFAIGLNGMRVYFADSQGVLQEYTNIVLGEPSASLFVPEPGAAVLKKSD
jgi:hypothetical protein